MDQPEVVRRDIERVWDVTPVDRGPGHRAGMVLEPGRWDTFDPFLLMAEDWFGRGTFGDHPHRGIETVTYVIDGQLTHHDNQGGEGTLFPGDVQWMTAGRGVVHREEPESGQVHSLQLWVNLRREQKMTAPRYQTLRRQDMPVRPVDGGEIRVFSGRSGNVQAATKNHVPVTFLELSLNPGAAVTLELPGNDNGFVYVLEGQAVFGAGRTLAGKGQALLMGRGREDAPSSLEVHAQGKLHALLIAGQPVREPVVAYGPFVMNTQQEIQEAFEAYRSGEFGK